MFVLLAADMVISWLLGPVRARHGVSVWQRLEADVQ